MEKSIIAGAVIVIIAIIIVAAYALTYQPAGQQQATSIAATTPSGNNSTGLTNTGAAALASGCTGSSAFGCANASITASGQLSLSLASRSAATLYNIHVACIAYNSSTDRPSNVSSWYALASIGTTRPANFTGTSVGPYGTENIASLQCYTASGKPASLAPGQAYEGLVLVNYTPTDNPVSQGVPWQTAGAAEVNLKAT